MLPQQSKPSSIEAPGGLEVHPGEVIADRFVVERLAGRGGMGTVYRALDRLSSLPVALKLMASERQDAVRFTREALILAELSHPFIVRYVAHGTTQEGKAFLAMEWLDGEDLSERLARSKLTIEESLIVLRRVCEALAPAHACGIVHRDIKPSNLFLVGGEASLVKVLDFGAARIDKRGRLHTRSGEVLGTIGYMAPEQAMGALDVDARADAFAVGCVLFECLTGQPAFAAQHAVAVLAKVLREDPPRPSEFRPEVGAALDGIVLRLLAKNREARPKDATAILDALGELESLSSGRPARSWREPEVLTGSEQRIVSVLLAQPARGEATTIGDTRRLPDVDADLYILARKFDAEPFPLQGGALFLVFSSRGAATDQAAHATMCAQRLRLLRPDLRFAIATGRSETMARVPMGAVIDRAADLLSDGVEGALGIFLDDLTAELLDPRFLVQKAHRGARLLLHDRGELQTPRLLMGKPTPCVGRDKELGYLDATLKECTEDRVARIVLVTAPPGVGKSRLASEWMQRVKSRELVRVLFARAEPITAGSALSLMQALVGSAAGFRGADSAETQHGRLRDYFASLVTGEMLDHLAEFLGALVGDPADRAPSPLLRAAGNDPAVMREQYRRALRAWLDAEAKTRTVLVVLEDLHWGDSPSVTYLEEIVDDLADRPLFLLALARPEVDERFARFGKGPRAQEIRLSPLTRRAAEHLARTSLTELAVDQAVIARIVDLADGNAFFLEELIRRVADGGTDLPETVLAMAQSRLEQLAPEARRVLRAASIFGITFWRGAVAAMLGKTIDAPACPEDLAAREILVRSRDSRFPGEREYLFRHALLREAASAMLTDEDRARAHRSGAEWLERAGEKNARVVADHFEQGGAPEQAIPWIVRAARMAIDAGDIDGAVALSERGIRLGASERDRGVLLLVRAHAAALSAHAETDLLKEALGLLEEHSALWWLALSLLLWGASSRGEPEESLPYVELALATPPGHERTGPEGFAVFMLTLGMVVLGQGPLAWTLLETFETATSGEPNDDPLFVAWLNASRCQLATVAPPMGQWQPERALLLGRRSAAEMARAGSEFGESMALMHAGGASMHLGLYEEAEAACRRSMGLATRNGDVSIEGQLKLILATVLGRRGRFAEALEVVASACASSDKRVAHYSRAVAAEVYHREARFDLALGEARAAIESPYPHARSHGRCMLARTYLALGCVREALGEAEQALRDGILVPPDEVDVLTTRAEAYRAVVDLDAAQSSIAQARDVLFQIVQGMENADLCHSFLTNVETNARALALAADWLGPATS